MEQKVIIWEQKDLLFFPEGAKMRIAICDWDPRFVNEVKRMIYGYAEKFRIEIVVDCFVSGEMLIKAKENYQMIFLGYKLKGINGFDTARLIRRTDINTAIVFVSEYTDFVYDSFEVTPYRFLTKPLEELKLFEILNIFFKDIGSNYCLWIKSRDNTVFLNTNEIYYIEADNKHSIIHLERESISCNRTMARVFEVLPKNCFSKVNRAYIVNLNHIKNYNPKEINLSNNQRLSIGRSYFKSFKEEYKLLKQPIEL